MQSERKIKPTRIWILRHGQSNLNQAQCFQGAGAESELTPHGIRSAQLAGQQLVSVGVDAIYSSPLTRAMQTSALILEVLADNGVHPEFHTEATLREIELPGWEGFSYAAVRQEHSESYARFRNTPSSFVLQDAHGRQVWPALELQTRVYTLMPHLLSRHGGANILLVTHGGPARMLLLAALGLPLDYFNSVQQSHCGLSCIVATGWPYNLRLEVLNETRHTGETLPKLKEGKTGLRLLMAASDISNEDGRQGSEDLAQLLESLPLHGVLTGGRNGETAAKQLLRFGCPATIDTCSEAALQSAFENHLRRQRSGGLYNLFITGRRELLSGLIAHAMGPAWQGDSAPSISPEVRSGLSIIHLPGTVQRPVLQAMNTHQAAWAFARGAA